MLPKGGCKIFIVWAFQNSVEQHWANWLNVYINTALRESAAFLKAMNILKCFKGLKH